MKRAESAVSLLVSALDEAFDRRSWHGTNLRGSLRGLTAEQAVWRPSPGRHNIWEIVVHAAYWKYVVRRLLTGDKKGAFPLRGSNWFPRQDADAKAWRQEIEWLVAAHRQLRAAVAALPDSQLSRASPKKRYTYAEVIRGIAAHDLYHAGQIQLLKRLRE